MGRVPANKGQEYPADVLQEHEVGALLRACNGGLTGLRNRALIAVLYRGGLRVSEALALVRDDVREVADGDEILHAIHVRRGKGGKSRTVGIDGGAYDLLKKWMEARREGLGMKGLGAERVIKRGPIFCSLKGARLDDSYVRRLLPRLAEKAGIERRVHPHMLRHSHAFELAMEGVPMPAVQAQLGHSSLKTTTVYVSHLGAGVVNVTARRKRFGEERA